MSRARNPFPQYKYHKPSDQAVMRVYRPDGTERMLYLGAYNSPESRAEYARICAELLPGAVYIDREQDTTVAQAILLYLDHVDVYYRTPEGKPGSEVKEIDSSLKILNEFYGPTPACSFGPKSLAVVRDKMIALGWCRSVINARIGRIKRCFKWLTAQEYVPPAVYQGLRALEGLKIGRSQAPDAEPVEPVRVEVYEATLPHLPRMARAITELLRWTGMRPGEACRLRMDEVDKSGSVWVYRPFYHKTRYRGKKRVIPLGPKAQSAMQSYLDELAVPVPIEAPVFCGLRERERRYAQMRSKRKSKVTPSQRSRKKAAPKRVPRGGYTPMALVHAVDRAAKAAGTEHWHPNQLRHLFATEVRRLFGLEAAQVCLGHSRADITQTYAERDQAKAVDVAAKIG